MTALSIILSDEIVKESSSAAKKLGVSRIEFIKQAIVHELADFKKKQIQNNVIKIFNAMKASNNYFQKNRIED